MTDPTHCATCANEPYLQNAIALVFKPVEEATRSLRAQGYNEGVTEAINAVNRALMEHGFPVQPPPAPTVEEVVEAVFEAAPCKCSPRAPALLAPEVHLPSCKTGPALRAIRAVFASNERGGTAAGGDAGRGRQGGVAGGPASPTLGEPGRPAVPGSHSPKEKRP